MHIVRGVKNRLALPCQSSSTLDGFSNLARNKTRQEARTTTFLYGLAGGLNSILLSCWSQPVVTTKTRPNQA